jgi:receptor expression-enhancing protein 5/6
VWFIQTIYGLFSLLEGSTDDLLGKMPYYYHAKFVALLLLQLPSTQVGG